MKTPLIAHIILNLDVGGLETGLVNLINHMPDRYRHAIICLGYASDFRERINRLDVEVYELHKKDGKDLVLHFRLWKLLRQLRPDIVHTRDFATLDSVLVVALAGVRCRVHSLHGWRMKQTLKYRVLHNSLKYLIQRHVAVSRDLASWLHETIRIPETQVQAICNGVDAKKFYPSDHSPGLADKAGDEFGADKFIVGTAGRLVEVKDQLTLIKAFGELVHEQSRLAERLRLVIIGDGPLRSELYNALETERVQSCSWLAGSRDDVPELLRGIDLFVLPSLSEGVSNTILEAMASGLPVIATDVGGNAELVADGETGQLVPACDPAALATAIRKYALAPEELLAAGRAGRQRVEENFSMSVMASRYTRVYDELLQN